MRHLLRNRPFLFLWSGETTSLIGDWLSMVAVYATLQELFPGGMAIALALVAKSLPIFVVSPLAGRLAERWDLRGLMLATTVARAVLPILLILAFHWKSLGLILGLEVVMASLTGLCMPAQATAVPRLVSPAGLRSANALTSGTWSATFALGTALGGLLTQLFGFEIALLLDSLTFLLSAALLMGLPALGPERTVESSQERTWLDVLALLGRRPRMLAALSVRSLLGLLGGASVALPLLGSAFHSDTAALSIGGLYAVRGLGLILGSLMMALVSFELGRGVVGGLILAGLSYLAAGLAGTYALVGFGFLLAGAGTSLAWVSGETLAQMEVPENCRGRLFALQSAFGTLSAALVSLLAGGLVDLGVSAQGLLMGSGVLALVISARWRRFA